MCRPRPSQRTSTTRALPGRPRQRHVARRRRRLCAGVRVMDPSRAPRRRAQNALQRAAHARSGAIRAQRHHDDHDHPLRGLIWPIDARALRRCHSTDDLQAVDRPTRLSLPGSTAAKGELLASIATLVAWTARRRSPRSAQEARREPPRLSKRHARREHGQEPDGGRREDEDDRQQDNGAETAAVTAQPLHLERRSMVSLSVAASAEHLDGRPCTGR
jgi:hypothetical protein